MPSCYADGGCCPGTTLTIVGIYAACVGGDVCVPVCGITGTIMNGYAAYVCSGCGSPTTTYQCAAGYCGTMSGCPGSCTGCYAIGLSAWAAVGVAGYQSRTNRSSACTITDTEYQCAANWYQQDPSVAPSCSSPTSCTGCKECPCKNDSGGTPRCGTKAAGNGGISSCSLSNTHTFSGDAGKYKFRNNCNATPL